TAGIRARSGRPGGRRRGARRPRPGVCPRSAAGDVVERAAPPPRTGVVLRPAAPTAGARRTRAAPRYGGPGLARRAAAGGEVGRVCGAAGIARSAAGRRGVGRRVGARIVTAAAVSVPAARTLRRRLRRVRSAHRDTSLAGILTDVYMGVMAVAIYGTAAVTVIRRHLRLPPTASAADSGVRAALLFAAALVTAGLGWQTARSLGPLYLTGAGRYWAAGTPVDRAGWLRPALGWVVLAGAGGGALLGFLVGLVGADAGGPIAG